MLSDSEKTSRILLFLLNEIIDIHKKKKSLFINLTLFLITSALCLNAQNIDPETGPDKNIFIFGGEMSKPYINYLRS